LALQYPSNWSVIDAGESNYIIAPNEHYGEADGNDDGHARVFLGILKPLGPRSPIVECRIHPQAA
jgi:hypothetical protein